MLFNVPRPVVAASRPAGRVGVVAVLVAGALAISPAAAVSAAEPGDGSRFDTWAGYQVGRSPVEALAGDFNEDGAADVAWVRNNQFDNTLSVTLNLGDGTMDDPREFVATAGSATDGVVTDLDGDGNLDVAVVAEGACLCNDIIDLYLGDGTGDFAHSTATGGNGPLQVAAGDLDADGDPDLALTNFWGGPTVSVLLNDGDATFAPEPSTRSASVRSASSPLTSTATPISMSWQLPSVSTVRWRSIPWSTPATGR